MWEISDEVNVLSLWSDHANVTSTKWLERKEALEQLSTIISTNPRLSTSSLTIYGELMDSLRKILKSDSNVQVVVAALKVVEMVAEGLRNKFTGYIPMMLPSILEKSKDKKIPVREHVGAALDAVSGWCDSSKISKDVVDQLQKATSPEMKRTICEFLYRYFKRQNKAPIDFLKTILPILVKLASDPDAATRDSACSTIGSAKRLLGEGISALIQPLVGDKAKMEKIDAACTRAREEWSKEQAERGVIVAQNNNSLTSSADAATSSMDAAAVSVEAVDPWKLKDPVNLMSKIPNDWSEKLTSKKWKDRKDIVDAVLKELESEPRLEKSSSLSELIEELMKDLATDLNVNVATASAKCLAGIANGLRHDFSAYSPKLLAICFERLKEKKEIYRKEYASTADAVSFTTKSSCYIEEVEDGLTSKNPQTRGQTCLFLSRLILKHDRSTLPLADLKQWTASIQKCCCDGDAEVREGAFRIVAVTSHCLGAPAIPMLFPEVSGESLKQKKVEEILEKMKSEEERAPIPKAPHMIFKKMYEGAKSGPVTGETKKPLTVLNKEKSGPAPFKARSAPKTVAPAIKPVLKAASQHAIPAKMSSVPIKTSYTPAKMAPKPTPPVKPTPNAVRAVPQSARPTASRPIAIRPAVTSSTRPATAPTPKTGGSLATRRSLAPSSTISGGPAPRVSSINVPRPALSRPVAFGQAVSGIPTLGSHNSRIPAPSGIRPPSSSASTGIPRPSSRPGSRLMSRESSFIKDSLA